MDIDKAEELAELLQNSDCSQLTVTRGDTVIHLKKAARRGVRKAFAASGEAPGAEKPAEKTVEVRADLVGLFTFAAPFAPGDRIERNTLIGHIKSFTIVNDVKAPCGGEIIRIDCEDNSPVEYGQAVLVIKEG